jgi:tetratricopeptide (TPR) repeat protein
LSDPLLGVRRRRRRVLWALAAIGLVVCGALAGRHYWADRHLQAAREALGRDDLDSAHEHIERCLAIGGDRPAVHLLAARIERRQDNYDEADRHLKDCEQLQGVTEETVLERELLRAQQGDPDSVIENLKAVAARQPDQAVPIWEAVAKGYLNCYAKVDALKYANRLLRESPGHVQGRLCRGKTLESFEKYEAALPDYEEAFRLAPNSPEVRLRLAALLYRLGRPTEALVHYEWLRERKPVDADVLLGLARCHYDLHELDAARQLFRQLTADSPNDFRGWLELGRLEFHAGNTNEAEPSLRRASGLAPRNHDVWLAWRNCLEALGSPQEAEAATCRERLREIGNESREINDLIEKAKFARNDAPNRYRIGTLLLARGQEEDAVSWFFSAIGEDPKYAPAHTALADYFERKGEHYRAELHRRAAQDE